jgi:hypothetical protein
MQTRIPRARILGPTTARVVAEQVLAWGHYHPRPPEHPYVLCDRCRDDNRDAGNPDVQVKVHCSPTWYLRPEREIEYRRHAALLEAFVEHLLTVHRDPSSVRKAS